MDNITRKTTRRIMLGDIPIGGNAPISIQSMLSIKTSNIPEATTQIRELISAGCEIIRCAVMDISDANAIKELKKISSSSGC